jgi:hypothetical protein
VGAAVELPPQHIKVPASTHPAILGPNLSFIPAATTVYCVIFKSSGESMKDKPGYGNELFR